MASSSGVRTCSMTTSWLLFLLHIGSLVVTSSGNSLGVLLILIDSPVKDIVVLEPFTHKKVTEDLSKIRIIWLVIEAKGTGVVEVDGELIRESAAKDLGGRGHLLFHDTVVLLLLSCSLESLPR